MKLPGCQLIVFFKGIVYEDIVGIGQLLRCSRSWSIDDASRLTVFLQQKAQEVFEMCTPSSSKRALMSRRVNPFLDRITTLRRLSIASLVIVSGKHSLRTAILRRKTCEPKNSKLTQQLFTRGGVHATR